jgi:ribose/xylose/arabinose/galactoside ABC-type transport system permease subunit
VSEKTSASLKERLSARISQLGMILVFVFMVVIFSVLSRSFFTFGNFINIANQTATVSVVAFGMTMVMLSGGIDLSVGSLVSLSAVVCACCWAGRST